LINTNHANWWNFWQWWKLLSR